MTAWTSAFCEANGLRLHFLRTGGVKPPAVWLHGLTGSGACWTPLARALEGELDLILPDARGHGASSAPPDGYTYDDLADNVVGLVRGLPLARPVLVGHSMGGMTAALAASRCAASFRGVVLVDPTFLSPARQREVWESDVARQHREALGQGKDALVAQSRARHPGRSAELIDLQAAARLKTAAAAFDVLEPPNPDYREVVRALDLPTLLVVGDHTVVTVEMAAELRELNPRVRVEHVAGAGHGLPFDEPERLAKLLAAFSRVGPYRNDAR